jgi:hypothetical protein
MGLSMALVVNEMLYNACFFYRRRANIGLFSVKRRHISGFVFDSKDLRRKYTRFIILIIAPQKKN